MKTSNKLLFGLLVFIILFILSFVIMVRVYYEGAQKEKDLPDIKAIKHTVVNEQELASFHKVVANIPGRIYYERGDQPKIKIVAGENIINDVVFQVNYEELNISFNEKKKKNEIFDIYIQSDSLTSIVLFQGVRFESDDISDNSCYIKLGASTVDAHINMHKIEIDGEQKAIVTIEGVTDQLKVISLGASIMNLSGLKADTAHITGSGKSKIDIFVTGNIFVDIRDNTVLQYSGDPVFRDMNINSGAVIQKKENELLQQ